MTQTDALPPPEPQRAGDGPRFIRSLKLTNLLSFGPAGEEIELRSLNVLVGANGSGKTNFVEALGLLAASLGDLTEPIRKGGGIQFWINHAGKPSAPGIEVEAQNRRLSSILRHSFSFEEENQRLRLQKESVKSEIDNPLSNHHKIVYSYDDGEVATTDRGGYDFRPDIAVANNQSVLSQIKGVKIYPELDVLQYLYSLLRLYRSWSFGPDSPLRKPQASDLPNDFLAEDYINLFLVLNRMEFEPDAKAEFLARLRDFLPDVTDYKLQIVGGTILMFLMEGRNAVPATRLSDGTLRWLCLLAILVAPSPPGVIVLEEPELGLHPDMINTLADMLKQAATRHQLVITTHSDILIDALSDVPEAVMVVEKEESGTTIRRLDAEEMKPWLEKYRLGRLWMMGQIGGTRW